ncbi:hypothetical protein [Bacillus xiapuensis]|uniref:hypothetical protein n=1 Tax=Bacillus xiapuensis TaxID=2014075 RepID=UPI000C24B880|nr:hypothetical protein [Bacillus xiapuensis]
MKQKRIFILFPALAILIAAATSLDFSSRLLLDEEKEAAAPKPASMFAAAEPSEEALPYQPPVFELEEKIVDIEEIGHRIVETYREYEIYRDGHGRIQKTVPTSHYTYLYYEKQ